MINLNSNVVGVSPQRTETNRQEFTTQRQSTANGSASGDKVTITSELLTGDDNVLSLGRLLLGGDEKLKAWSDKGFEINESSIRNAFDVFNLAFKEHMNTKNSRGVAINSYQIIANNQNVPAWFTEEKEQNISAIGDPATKSAFRSGDLYHVSIDNELNIRQVRNYQRIANL